MRYAYIFVWVNSMGTVTRAGIMSDPTPTFHARDGAGVWALVAETSGITFDEASARARAMVKMKWPWLGRYLPKSGL